jgi:hypothetical protein
MGICFLAVVYLFGHAGTSPDASCKKSRSAG